MKFTVRIDDDAVHEIMVGARRYESAQPGRGVLFAEAVFKRIEQLVGFPNAGSPVWGLDSEPLARQVRLRRYPYVVVYVLLDDEIRVVAVAHEKQTPLYWKSRVDLSD